MYSFQTTIHELDSNVWKYVLPIPEDVSKDILKGENKRVICYLNGKVTHRAALMPKGDFWFVTLNKTILKKLGFPQVIEVKLELDTSKYGHDFPEELAVLFEDDSLTKQYFEALTPGKQRSLLYIVNSVKNTASRTRKSLAICDHLIELKGSLDFKLLNEKIKEYNARVKR